MAIRKRISLGQETVSFDEAEKREAAERLAERAADDRGVFDPTKDPYAGSYLEERGVPQSHSRVIAMGMAEQDKVLEPKEMRVHDLLANVRLMNNPGDNIERTYRNRIRSPLTGIRAFCVECQGGSPRAVARCDKVSCPLWPFRQGRNRFRNK